MKRIGTLIFFTGGEKLLRSALLPSISCLDLPLSSLVVQRDLFSIFSPLVLLGSYTIGPKCSSTRPLRDATSQHSASTPTTFHPTLSSLVLPHSFQVIRHGLQHFRNADILYQITSSLAVYTPNQHLLLSMLLSSQNIYPRIYSLNPMNNIQTSSVKRYY